MTLVQLPHSLYIKVKTYICSCGNKRKDSKWVLAQGALYFTLLSGLRMILGPKIPLNLPSQPTPTKMKWKLNLHVWNDLFNTSFFVFNFRTCSPAWLLWPGITLIPPLLTKFHFLLIFCIVFFFFFIPILIFSTAVKFFWFQSFCGSRCCKTLNQKITCQA